MRVQLAVTSSIVVGLFSALVACSGSEDVHARDCSDTPNAKGCKKASSSSSAEPLATAAPTTTVAPPLTAPPRDAGTDAPKLKPDGGAPAIPRPDVACTDLLRCCARVQDTIERAACYGIGYNSSSGSCANAIIAYQVFGGCSHDPFELPDIFNPDGTVNEEKDCSYLTTTCDEFGCSQSYQCDGTYVGGGGSGTTDYCEGLSNVDDSCGRNEYYCCQYGGDYYCGSDPTMDYSYCY